MLTIERIKSAAAVVSLEFPIKTIQLFGSYAVGTSTEQSDVDLLVEFTNEAVSLITIASLKCRLEELLGKEVDVVHAPVPEDSLLEIGKTVVVL